MERNKIIRSDNTRPIFSIVLEKKQLQKLYLLSKHQDNKPLTGKQTTPLREGKQNNYSILPLTDFNNFSARLQYNH